MSVDKFGRSGKEVIVTGVPLNTISNNFLRRDGANSATAPLNMGGNALTNVSDPTMDQDATTKTYVDKSCVTKSGDTMTGDLQLTNGSDEIRQLGCLDLTAGKTFCILLGDQSNQLKYSKTDQVTMETARGFLVKADNSDVIGFNRRVIEVHKDISMNNHRIKHLTDPTSSGEPATKRYVDARKPLITIWAETNDATTANEYEWSFGAGSDERGHRKIGYTMLAQGKILRMGLTASSSVGNTISHIMQVNVVVNGRENTNYYTFVLAGQFSGTTTFEEPLQLNEGDRINFRSHTTNPSVCCGVVSLLIELDL